MAQRPAPASSRGCKCAIYIPHIQQRDLTQHLPKPTVKDGNTLKTSDYPLSENRALIPGARLYGSKGLTSLSRTTIWRGVREGWFPSPVKVSPGRNAWYGDEIQHWLSSRSRVNSARSLTNPPANKIAYHLEKQK